MNRQRLLETAEERTRELIREQAALRQVAILVARESSADELFAAVAEQIAHVFRVPHVRLLRYEPDGSVVVGGFSEDDDEPFPIGSHWPLDSPGVTASVRQTGRPARVDDYGPVRGEIAAVAREAGMRSAVASPIIVGRRLWGAMVVLSPRHEPFPETTESRLTDFTELVATAIANANSRAALERLADEQAALRRVATIAARDSSPAEVFAAVTVEAARVLETEAVGLLRFEPDATAVLVAQSQTPWDPPPLGTVFPLDGDNVIANVSRTGQSARADDWSGATGAVAAMADVLGVRSAVAAPIVVEGRLWGTLIAATSQNEPLPEDTESRISEFTNLVAIAIATSEARAEVERLAEEQAALKRVAELVAEGRKPEDVFRAVSAEVGVLFGSDVSAIVRFEDDGMATVLGDLGGPHVAGDRVSLDPGYVVHRVHETSGSARFDTDDPSGEDPSSMVFALGIRSAVASPILVEGRLWGAITAAALEGPLAPGAEQRLNEFTGLLATAIANTQAREQVTTLAEEQAALRRVATLVAENPESQELFSAVAREVAGVLDVRGVIVDRFEPDGSQVTLGSTYDGELAGAQAFLGVGVHLPLHPGTLGAAVRESRGPARVQDYSTLRGRMGAAARAAGIGSGCAAPIIVDGQLWGQMCAFSARGTVLPEGTEHRLGDFVELVATAISNYDARIDLRLLADEQAALRRVATLVAHRARPLDLFAAVAEEVGLLHRVDHAYLTRFDSEDAVTAMAWWSRAGEPPPVAMPQRLPAGPLTASIRTSGGPVRLDPYHDPAAGPLEDGLRSSVAAPITVEGRTWGMIGVSSKDAERPPEPGTEARLTKFTDLVATAIANAESREALAQLADEQAALRRVATLVAEGVPADELFAGVMTEVAHLFLDVDPTLVASVIRFDPGPECVLVGVSRAYEHEPLGARWAPKELYVSTRVLRTGSSARVNETDLDAFGGPDADVLRLRGFQYQVGSPVVVEGQLWGAMCLNSREELPPDTDERLEGFTELVATAIANAESQQALSELAEELAASRRRIVAAADNARRRIERDLHDGVQQRLVSLGLGLDAMRADPPTGGELQEQLAGATRDVRSVLDALVELARGIHPAILAHGGLAAALRALARRSAVPVEVEAQIDAPVPNDVEVAAYYVAAEALTNCVKHARASVARVEATSGDGILTLIVRDDGVGGADPRGGSGLVGLQDRVEALGGTIRIDSSAGHGTCIAVTFPIAPKPEGRLHPPGPAANEAPQPTTPALTGT